MVDTLGTVDFCVDLAFGERWDHGWSPFWDWAYTSRLFYPQALPLAVLHLPPKVLVPGSAIYSRVLLVGVVHLSFL